MKLRAYVSEDAPRTILKDLWTEVDGYLQRMHPRRMPIILSYDYNTKKNYIEFKFALNARLADFSNIYKILTRPEVEGLEVRP